MMPRRTSPNTNRLSVTWTRLGENSMMLRSMAAGVSQLNCYEPLFESGSPQPGPAIIRAEAGVALSEPMFSPNRVSARAVVSGPAARVVLNQNFEDGWSSNAGIVERDPGRFAVGPAACRIRRHCLLQFCASRIDARPWDLARWRSCWSIFHVEPADDTSPGDPGR